MKKIFTPRRLLLLSSVLFAWSGMLLSVEIYTEKEVKAGEFVVKHIQVKQLHCLELDLLNLGWEKKPFETIRLNISIKTLRQFLQEIGQHKASSPS
ncbi:hypothetical protein IH879_22490, partial [candidate division KSB1 bacterium]|nr:hypothetical protein [candidate division KSB1 bacterium]